MPSKKNRIALKAGHPTPWRKTVAVGTDKKPETKQLVFFPGEVLELTDQEVAGLTKWLECGLLIDADNPPKPAPPELPKTDAALVARVEELEKQLAEATARAQAAEARVDEFEQILASDDDFDDEFDDDDGEADD